jgi:signal transduction histidine kinase
MAVFKGLRLRLTLLYLLAALALIALVAAGSYALLTTYFQSSIDLALKHRMAQEFQRLGQPLPAELSDAERAWFTSRSQPNPTARPPSHGDEHDDQEGDGEASAAGGTEELHDAELAAIFVLPLSASGQLLPLPGLTFAPVAANQAAASAALEQGSDWRTIAVNGERVRLLTYRLGGSAPALVQVGRTLTDQDRVLSRLLLGLLALGAGSAVALGGCSWWLAGRSLRPAQQAWERQQSFVANASHELRAPLTLLRASAEVALRSLARGDDRRQLLGDVLHETDHMSRLMDDLLLLSRLDVGRIKVDRQPIPLADLFADVRRQVGRLAEERSIRLCAECESDVVLADPTRLRQVLIILLDNALRHTPGGGSVEIGTQKHGNYVNINVADTGSGIAAEHVPHVFERFYRGVGGSRGSQGGSGLGLSIAKGLVEAQGGQIAIESQIGQGTHVTVMLPATSNPRSRG